MSGYDKPGRIKWSLALTGLGTTLSVGSGNSGAWASPTANPPYPQQNQESPIDLRDVEDAWLIAYCTGITATPSLVVTVNAFDNTGNPWPVISLPAITAAGAGNGKQVSFGKHGGSATSYVVLPAWGQVSWVVTGAASATTGTAIELWVR